MAGDEAGAEGDGVRAQRERGGGARGVADAAGEHDRAVDRLRDARTEHEGVHGTRVGVTPGLVAGRDDHVHPLGTGADRLPRAADLVQVDQPAVGDERTHDPGRACRGGDHPDPGGDLRIADGLDHRGDVGRTERQDLPVGGGADRDVHRERTVGELAGLLQVAAQDARPGGRLLADARDAHGSQAAGVGDRRRQVDGLVRPQALLHDGMHDPDEVGEPARQRRDGLKEALSRHDIRWIETITGHDPEAAAHRILEILRAHPEAAAVLATGQADTEGAALAAERLGRPVYAAGFDLSPEILRLIVEGHLACTVDQQPYTQGFYPVIQLVLNIRYGLRPVDMDAGACLIDRSNVARIAALAKTGYR